MGNGWLVWSGEHASSCTMAAAPPAAAMAAQRGGLLQARLKSALVASRCSLAPLPLRCRHSTHTGMSGVCAIVTRCPGARPSLQPCSSALCSPACPRPACAPPLADAPPPSALPARLAAGGGDWRHRGRPAEGHQRPLAQHPHQAHGRRVAGAGALLPGALGAWLGGWLRGCLGGWLVGWLAGWSAWRNSPWRPAPCAPHLPVSPHPDTVVQAHTKDGLIFQFFK